MGDYDSDTMLLTDYPLFVETARRNYDKFLVPTSFVPAQKRKRYYSAEQQSDLDVKTSVNKIGEIINTSQQLNSLYWNKLHKGIQDDEIYQDICKLAILSNIEIDKSKKEYSLNTDKELKIIKQNHILKHKDSKTGAEKTVKPMFFKTITTENGYKLSSNHYYKYFNTPMDYLQKALGKFNFHHLRGRKDDRLPLSSILKPREKQNISGAYYAQRRRILDIISETKTQMDKLYMDYDSRNKEEKAEIRIMIANLRQDCIDYINSISICETTMYLLLTAVEDKEYSRCKQLLFTILFGTPNQRFFDMIAERSEPMMKLEEIADGDVHLYDITYHKIAK